MNMQNHEIVGQEASGFCFYFEQSTGEMLFNGSAFMWERETSDSCGQVGL